MTTARNRPIRLLHTPGSLLLLVLAGVCLVYYLPHQNILAVDSLLAWPITESMLHPDWYGSEDLIVRAGVTGNFLLYKLLAYIPLLQDNLPLRDVLIYLPIFFLYLMVWYDLFFTICEDRILSFISVLFLLFSDAKLGLNWSNAPIPHLLSVTSVQFLQVFSFSLFLKGNRNFALVIIALTGYLHPATSLTFGFVLSLLVFVDAVRDRELKHLSPALFFALLYLPNALMIAGNSQGALQVTENFFKIFALFQYHVFLGDHFREGYAYTLALIALLLLSIQKGLISTCHDRFLLTFIVVSVICSALWLLNVYTLKNLQMIQTYFIMRIFYLLKPLVILLALMLYRNLSENRPLADRMVLLALPASFLWLSPIASLIIVIGITCYLKRRHIAMIAVAIVIGICIAFMLGVDTQPKQLFEYLGKIPRSNEMVAAELLLLVAYLTLVLPWTVSNVAGNPRTTIAPTISGKVTILFLIILLLVLGKIPFRAYALVEDVVSGTGPGVSLSRATSYGLSRRNPDYHALIIWAGRAHGKTFVVPPYDLEFASFRYLSGNGVYIHQYDINQLMYSPRYYQPGYERLLALGLDPKSGPKYRWRWGYNQLPLKALADLKADYIVFGRPAPPEVESAGIPVVFKNARYVVYSLVDIAAAVNTGNGYK